MERADNSKFQLLDSKFILPFAAIGGGMLPMVGGKAANLGGLVVAGFPVPAGFCVTTAAYDLVAADAGLEPTLVALAGTRTRRHGAPGRTRRRCEIPPVRCQSPDVLARAIAEAYAEIWETACLWPYVPQPRPRTCRTRASRASRTRI